MTATPQRTCTACRERRPQTELLRFARRRDGEVVPALVPRARPAGRTAYVCSTPACLERAVVRRTLTRSLGRSGLVIRSLTDAQSVRTVTEHALDREIEMLSRSGASSSVRLPQLQKLLHSLRQRRSA